MSHYLAKQDKANQKSAAFDKRVNSNVIFEAH